MSPIDPTLAETRLPQIYEDCGGYKIIQTTENDRTNLGKIEMAINHYLGKLSFWGWAFRDLIRNVPTICLPDAHDVYQGNIWGNSGNYVLLQDHEKGGFGHNSQFIIAV